MAIHYRRMTHPDIGGGLQLCRAAGWNQTERDWRLFLELSPDGCRVATADEGIVGTVATVRYEDRFSWIGMMLVDPAERGRGIGTQLMTQALESLHDMPSVRLDATPAGYGLYRSFEFVEEYRISRLEATGGGLLPTHNSARPMTQNDLTGVAAVDHDVFGADRSGILGWMLEGAPEYAWVIEEHGKVVGYILGRHGFTFEHLGPIVAENPQDAQQLLSACLRQSAKRFILDALHQNLNWRAWLEEVGFSEQRPLVRMFCRGNPYPGLPQNQFAILGPEFG